MISEQDLQICIKNCDYKIFDELVRLVLSHRNWNFDEVIIKETIEFCIKKLEKYNNKGKAFNFFVAIIGCYLTQHRRKLRKVNYERV
jgi:hypothetical protein